MCIVIFNPNNNPLTQIILIIPSLQVKIKVPKSLSKFPNTGS